MISAAAKRRTVRVVSGTLFLFGFLSGQASSENPQGRRVSSLPEDFQVVDLASWDGGEWKAGKSAAVFEAWGERFEMAVEPQPLFSAGARIVWQLGRGRRVELLPSRNYLAGTLRGKPDSQVRLAVSDAGAEGVILDGDEIYFLEPASQYWPGAASGETVIHRLSNQDLFGQPFHCSEMDDRSSGRPEFGAEASAAVSWDDAAPPLRAGALREVEVTLVIDSYYFRRYGAAAADRVHTLIHQANAIVEKEFGVTFRIAGTRVSTSPSEDEVSGATDTVQLLNEFGASRPLDGADLAHLFTARDLDGETLGAAWMGTACDERYGVGLSQDLNTSKARLVATVHELAHGLGARHDGRGYCSRYGPGWIMWPTLDRSASSFSECSEELVSLNLPRFSCVGRLAPEPLPAPEILAPRGAAHDPVLFEWEAVDGAEAYEVEIYDEAMETVVFHSAVGDTLLQPDFRFRQGHSYRWRVGAVREGEIGDKTAWESFALGSWRRLPR